MVRIGERMTDKFAICNRGLNGSFIKENGKIMEIERVVDLLKEQHETILSLHKTIEELDNCQKGQSHRINDLYLENKQLKDLITHLGYTIKYDGYRHISLELEE